MPYRRRSSTTRRTMRRRRTFKRRRSTRRNFMQRQAMAGSKMKFTTVFTPTWKTEGDIDAQSVVSWTVALLGGRGPEANGTYYNIANCNPDNKLGLYSRDFQQATIYGVSCKMIFAEPTDADSSPVQWAMAYSPQYLLNPGLTPSVIQSLSTYQTGPCSQNKSVTRYFPTSYVRKKLGIDYFPVDDLVTSGGIITDQPFDMTDADLYGGQLPAATGPSVTFRVYRNAPAVGTSEVKACRFQLTYYVRFRGTRGRTDLE